MVENKMLSFFPILVFGIGAMIQSFGIMIENNISSGMIEYISIIAPVILLMASCLIYRK